MLVMLCEKVGLYVMLCDVIGNWFGLKFVVLCCDCFYVVFDMVVFVVIDSDDVVCFGL